LLWFDNLDHAQNKRSNRKESYGSGQIYQKSLDCEVKCSHANIAVSEPVAR
jgi:hypothetical protein